MRLKRQSACTTASRAMGWLSKLLANYLDGLRMLRSCAPLHTADNASIKTDAPMRFITQQRQKKWFSAMISACTTASRALGWLSQLLHTRASGGPPEKNAHPQNVVVRERGWAVAASKMRPRKTLVAAGIQKRRPPGA